MILFLGGVSKSRVLIVKMVLCSISCIRTFLQCYLRILLDDIRLTMK